MTSFAGMKNEENNSNDNQNTKDKIPTLTTSKVFQFKERSNKGPNLSAAEKKKKVFDKLKKLATHWISTGNLYI
jgi:hypothetical protein